MPTHKTEYPGWEDNVESWGRNCSRLCIIKLRCLKHLGGCTAVPEVEAGRRRRRMTLSKVHYLFPPHWIKRPGRDDQVATFSDETAVPFVTGVSLCLAERNTYPQSLCTLLAERNFLLIVAKTIEEETLRESSPWHNMIIIYRRELNSLSIQPHRTVIVIAQFISQLNFFQKRQEWWIL